MLNSTDGRHPDYWFYLDGQGNSSFVITLICEGEAGFYEGSLIEWPWLGGSSEPKYHVNGTIVTNGWQLLEGLYSISVS
jgi:hypothetical protein